MREAQLTRDGRLQIPAAVRRRWGTSKVLIVDGGSYLDIKPLHEPAVAAAESPDVRDRLEDAGQR